MIELYKVDDGIVLTVEDNGLGIKDSDKERVFEAYFSTKKGSMGLGLYMTKMIIEKHLNGTISYKNLKNGIKFIIELPSQS
jgi:signal transduction histidine kinase